MKTKLQSPINWVFGLDDVIVWRMLVFGGVAGFLIAVMTVGTHLRKLAVFTAFFASGTAKISARATKASMERVSVEDAISTEAYYEWFAREHSPARTELFHIPDVEDSKVAPFVATELPLEDNDRIPHIILLAETGCGKTTLLRALLDRIPGDVIVADPHATKLSWQGFEVVGRPTAKHELKRVMEALTVEMKRRYTERDDYDEDEYKRMCHPITLIIEEAPAAKDSVDSDTWQDTIATIAREARKVRIRLVLISQGESIKALNLGGMSEIKENFAILRGGNFAKRHAKANKNDELFAWLQAQPRAWTFNDFGLSVADLSGYKPKPRNELHEDTKRILDYTRKRQESAPKPTIGTKGESKPLPPGINLIKAAEESERLPEVSIDTITNKVLKYANNKGEVSVGDVQKHNGIGGKFKLNADAIFYIFEELHRRGDVELIPNESRSYAKIVARNDLRDAA